MRIFALVRSKSYRYGSDSFVFLGFNLHAWITIVTVLTLFTILLFTKHRSDLVFLGAIGILFVTGVLDAKEAFSGFSSTSVVVIGVPMNFIILAANIFIVNVLYPLTPLS